MDAAQLIAQLQLQAHPEGGYFRRSYTADQQLSGDDSLRRPLMSSIFYLLTADSPIGHLHRNRSDILHFWQGGAPLHYTLLLPNGDIKEVVMGPDLAAGQQLQLLVPGDWWKASQLRSGDYGLISEAVCPGFDYRDHAFADAADIRASYGPHWPQLQPLLRRQPPQGSP